LTYTYDPAGNITRIEDDAQQTIYFNNQVVTPRNDYHYDAIYRLIRAQGREHIGQASQPQTTWDDRFRVHLPHPGDGQAMRLYTELYEYDAVGNFERMTHRATNGNWARGYDYNETSLIEPGKPSNRLSSTTVHPNGHQPIVESYTHDAHGNMTQMPHLPQMAWDYRDQLQATSRQVVNNGGMPEITYYVYDAAGQRVRKVTDRQGAPGETPTRKDERIYLGDLEIYRDYQNDGVTVKLEREMLHIMDDQQRIALVETRTLDTAGTDTATPQLIRYQFGNHLGSASLELDDQAQIISYEEFYPYGSTSYQAVLADMEVSPKRYRYTGMERDEENRLSYHGARYYVTWLGRWASCDPIGLAGGSNLYAYCLGNCIGLDDPVGTQPKNSDLTCTEVPTPPLDPSDADDPIAAYRDQVADELGGWDAAHELTDLEHAIVYSRSGGSSGESGDPEGVLAHVSPSGQVIRVGKFLTAKELRSARAIRCVDQSGASLSVWMTENDSGDTIFWSRDKKALTVIPDKGRSSMEVGFGASLLNPIDFFSGWVANKLIRRGAGALVDIGEDISNAAANKVTNNVAVDAAKATTKVASEKVASEGVRRVQLIERMQHYVLESARAFDDALARRDLVALGEFLYPKELNLVLRGGKSVAAIRGTFVEWRSRFMFALDPFIQTNVGRGGYLGLRYVVGKGFRRGFADFSGTNGGLLSGMFIDITTKKGLASHLARGYLEKGLVLTY
jgi:RHS repeat-associated protein